MRNAALLSSLFPVVALGALGVFGAGCSGGDSAPAPDNGGNPPLAPPPPGSNYTPGQTDFTSAPPAGQSGVGGARGASSDAAGASNAAPPSAAGAGKSAAAAPERKVEETDLYRLEGDRLYYLNAYRGLMVFDVSKVDSPKLLGRSPIFGTPVEMIVRNGVATVVVADWFGTTSKGEPFHGSIVRGLDASNPGNIKVLGDALLGGWVRDTRVVGDVLYAVSEDYGWSYGWDEGGFYASGGGGTASGGAVSGVAVSGGGTSKVIVSSVSFGGGTIAQKSLLEFPGYGGIFNVTSSAVLLAHDVRPPQTTNYAPSTTSELVYLDISDPGGTIKTRGTQTVNGSVQAWGADNGRFNLDFADGKTARLLAQKYDPSRQGSTYVLSTSDFTDADHPKESSELVIPSAGWIPAAHFDTGRLYLSPSGYYYGAGNATPIQIYDTSNVAAPKLAGETTVSGQVWNFIPAGNRLFALGSDTQTNGNGAYGSQVSLRYLDVSDASKPALLGSANFGSGWAWTPAAGTFKAFVRDDAQKLVVLPFSGWDYQSYQYNNGVQLIEYTGTSIRTAGAAKSKGWVERGIFVKGRVVSLSDLSLSVVDYTNHDAPKVVSELTLARNIVDAQPAGGKVAELSTDWWGYDNTESELRVVPQAAADEPTAPAQVVKIAGSNAHTYRNGAFTYVVSSVQVSIPCPNGSGGGGVGAPTPVGGGAGGKGSGCTTSVPEISAFEETASGLVAHGKVQLPAPKNPYGYYYGGYGYYWYDWYNGSDAVQVNGSTLAFRRWAGYYQVNGKYVADTNLYVVDLKNADKPSVSTTAISNQDDAWWGNMRSVGGTLYVTHYEWVNSPWAAVNANGSGSGNATPPEPSVRYYLDPIDLTDPAHPKVENRINVPGFLVGGSEADPSLLYTVDYHWDPANGGTERNELAVVKIVGSKAVLQSWTALDGYVGNLIVKGSKAYTTVQRYPEVTTNGKTTRVAQLSLHELDFTNPVRPVDRAVTQKGWGWLLGVEGDRAIVTSGWGSAGIDVYKLSSGAAPAFDRFVRTRGFWLSSLSRENNRLFLTSGYWGVQTVDL